MTREPDPVVTRVLTITVVVCICALLLGATAALLRWLLW